MRASRLLVLIGVLAPVCAVAQPTAPATNTASTASTTPATAAASTAPRAASRPASAGTAMTRAEFVAMIADHFKWVHWSEYNDYAKAVPRQFSDVKIGDRFWKQIDNALEEAIVEPDMDTQAFFPNRPMTRADAAVVFARAFGIAPAPDDALVRFGDTRALTGEQKVSVNALASRGFLKGRTVSQWAPSAGITRAEARAAMQAIVAAVVAPVQVMPKPGTTSNRRNVNMTTETPGATVYYTLTDDHTEPPDPTTASKAYDATKGFLLFDVPMGATVDAKYWTLKARAVKDGMTPSAVRTFTYYITRPQVTPFKARLVHAPTATSPAVWDIINDNDYHRPHTYYIEGTTRGMVFDAGQYPASKANLKTFIDTLATKPYDAMLGHNNPDHVEQIASFTEAGVRLYLTPQDKGSLLASKRADFTAAATASVPVRDGDVFDLGNVTLHAYQVPGHSPGLVILQDKTNGWVFGTDMFGCNRPATVDITAYTGVKMDLFLSMVQQLYSNLRKGGGKIVEVYNAHNDVPVGYPGIWNFQQAVQQLIDVGEKATVPSMRGSSPGGAPSTNQRTSVVGDMWRDKNWIALWIGGQYGGSVDYLTKPTTAYATKAAIDYNATGGIEKYAVLSNLEIDGGTLVGVDLTWAAPFNGVACTLANKFDPWTYAYDVKVPAGTRTIGIVPTAMSNRITSLSVNGIATPTRSRRAIPVTDGARITIDIVAPNTVTTSQYVLTVKVDQ